MYTAPPRCFHLILAACVSFQNYVPTVFENYTASFEIDKQRIELNMWDTSGEMRLWFGFSHCLAGLFRQGDSAHNEVSVTRSTDWQAADFSGNIQAVGQKH